MGYVVVCVPKGVEIRVSVIGFTVLMKVSVVSRELVDGTGFTVVVDVHKVVIAVSPKITDVVVTGIVLVDVIETLCVVTVRIFEVSVTTCEVVTGTVCVVNRVEVIIVFTLDVT